MILASIVDFDPSQQKSIWLSKRIKRHLLGASLRCLLHRTITRSCSSRTLILLWTRLDWHWPKIQRPPGFQWILIFSEWVLFKVEPEGSQGTERCRTVWRPAMRGWPCGAAQPASVEIQSKRYITLAKPSNPSADSRLSLDDGALWRLATSSSNQEISRNWGVKIYLRDWPVPRARLLKTSLKAQRFIGIKR